MSALTKKPHTEFIEKIFRFPVSKSEQISNYLKRQGALDITESKRLKKKEEERIPWREMDAIQEQVKKYGERGVTLRGARGKEEITQVQLSKTTGIPRRHISEMENGKRPIGKKNAKKLAEALNCDYRIFL